MVYKLYHIDANSLLIFWRMYYLCDYLIYIITINEFFAFSPKKSRILRFTILDKIPILTIILHKLISPQHTHQKKSPPCPHPSTNTYGEALSKDWWIWSVLSIKTDWYIFFSINLFFFFSLIIYLYFSSWM